jgi:hypothetical protein
MRRNGAVPVEIGEHNCIGISVCAVAGFEPKTKNIQTVSNSEQVRRIKGLTLDRIASKSASCL